MTVIYSDFGDNDTRILRKMWEGMDAKVVSVTESTQKEICDAISNEEDTLLLCGHGTPRGLLHPQYGYAVNDRMLRENLKARNLIGIWCNASDFARFYDYKGFFSDMFISNSIEAEFNGITGYSDKKIWEDERLFCEKVNILLKEGVPLKAWKDILMESYDIEDEVEDFNYTGLVYLW